MYTLITLDTNGLQLNKFKTQNECFDFVQKSKCNKYKIYQPNEKRDITFLNSFIWSSEKNDFVIDITKAKEIKKNILRQVREALFRKLDAAFMRAIEAEDSQQKQYIISLKKEFREITDLELPNTEQELLDFMPSVFEEVFNLKI
jgi:hypothetical protein